MLGVETVVPFAEVKTASPVFELKPLHPFWALQANCELKLLRPFWGSRRRGARFCVKAVLPVLELKLLPKVWELKLLYNSFNSQLAWSA